MNCSICGLPKENIVGSVLPQCMCGWQKTNPPGTPQQRTWVGLTNEEVKDALRKVMHSDINGVVRAIEAKLKEKNT